MSRELVHLLKKRDAFEVMYQKCWRVPVDFVEQLEDALTINFSVDHIYNRAAMRCGEFSHRSLHALYWRGFKGAFYQFKLYGGEHRQHFIAAYVPEAYAQGLTTSVASAY